jgi:hypothetical protein
MSSRLKTSGSFKKGVAKGKPKGALNKTTKEAKEILNQILFSELESVKDALAGIKAKDKYRYLDIFAKLLSFSLPKKTDLTTDDESLNMINITYIKK